MPYLILVPQHHLIFGFVPKVYWQGTSAIFSVHYIILTEQALKLPFTWGVSWEEFLSNITLSTPICGELWSLNGFCNQYWRVDKLGASILHLEIRLILARLRYFLWSDPIYICKTDQREKYIVSPLFVFQHLTQLPPLQQVLQGLMQKVSIVLNTKAAGVWEDVWGILWKWQSLF